MQQRFLGALGNVQQPLSQPQTKQAMLSEFVDPGSLFDAERCPMILMQWTEEALGRPTCLQVLQRHDSFVVSIKGNKSTAPNQDADLCFDKFL